jgi:hypothetical protein
MMKKLILAAAGLSLASLFADAANAQMVPREGTAPQFIREARQDILSKCAAHDDERACFYKSFRQQDVTDLAPILENLPQSSRDYWMCKIERNARVTADFYMDIRGKDDATIENRVQKLGTDIANSIEVCAPR